MNTFTAKKLGEVLAFSRIGLELTERGEGAAVEALGGTQATESFVQQLKEFANQAEQSGNDTTMQKADATEEKLRGMMEAYIKDEWDNPVELLEWLSFFLGSAAAHWSLVNGAARAIEDSQLEAGAQTAVDAYNAKLTAVQAELARLGQQKGAKVE